MLKNLYKKINWRNIQNVGFDMDGTLYDEAEFISDVYTNISKYLNILGYGDKKMIFNTLYKKWNDKGSSYPYVFDEYLSNIIEDNVLKKKIVNQCVNIFRNFQPSLTIDNKVKDILDELKEKYSLFLVSDGYEKLQLRKFNSLELSRWFDKEKVFFTGKYGKNFYKPSIKIKEDQLFSKMNLNIKNTVYFGDRINDELFAKKMKINFIKVKKMKIMDD